MPLELSEKERQKIPEIQAELDKGASVLYRKGLPIAVLLSSMGTLSLFAPIAVVTVPIAGLTPGALLMGHMFALRRKLVMPARQGMGLSRKLITRWVCRFGYGAGSLWAYGFAALPIIGLFAGPTAFTALTFVQHRYLRWHLQREYEGKPIHWLEKIVLILFALFAFTGLAIVLVTTWYVASRIECLLDGGGTSCFPMIFFWK
jgi:hypothetical protein